MSIGDLSRINTNVQSMQALGQLNKTNSELGVRQLRLATGSRLNRAEDDSAGYTIANKLQAKTRGQAQALANIGDAKGMLTVGEGALNSTMDILQTMKEKTVQAANDTMGSDERTAIQSQLDELTKEIDDVLGGAEFNGKKLFGGADDDADGVQDGTNALALNFQVGASASDSFQVDIDALDAEDLGVKGTGAGTFTAAADQGTLTGVAVSASAATGEVGSTTFTIDTSTGGSEVLNYTDANGDAQTVSIAGYTSGSNLSAEGVTFAFDGDLADLTNGQTFSLSATEDQTGGIDVSDSATSQAAITTIDAAIDKVNKAVSGLGDSQARLSIKQDNLDTSKTNYEAARSRIQDTDFAKEQMEITKLQILQQTGIGSLAQANSGPQSVLSLIG